MRIVSGLCAILFVLPLAGCGGSGGSASPQKIPFAVNAYATTSPDVAVSGQLYASSPDNSSITFAVTQSPAHGTLNLNKASGAYTYTPNSGYTGNDTFTFDAITANGTSANATGTIDVNPNPPSVSAFGEPVYVHNGGPASVGIVVRLSNPPNGQATVDYSTVDGSAMAGTDYTTESGTLTFGPGALSQTVTIPLSGVGEQGYRYFYVRLANPSSNIKLGHGTAAVVLRYWPEPLNDTGITGCATATNGSPTAGNTCPQAGYPSQDGDLGRDRANYQGALAKVGTGVAGYDFTKIGYDGVPLFNQNASYSVDPWACVRDNWTGLEWEVPSQAAGGGLFDAAYTYTWYDPTPGENGGSSGVSRGGPYDMDTYHFVQLANQYGLCGHSDWRLPTAADLRNLIDIGVGASVGTAGSNTSEIPAIPTLQSAGYWTSTPDPQNPDRVVVISQGRSYDSLVPKDGSTTGYGYYTILVRGGAG